MSQFYCEELKQMTEKLKRQQVIKQLRKELLSKYGPTFSDHINKELLSILNKSNVDSKDIALLHKAFAEKFAVTASPPPKGAEMPILTHNQIVMEKIGGQDHDAVSRSPIKKPTHVPRSSYDEQANTSIDQTPMKKFSLPTISNLSRLDPIDRKETAGSRFSVRQPLINGKPIIDESNYGTAGNAMVYKSLAGSSMSNLHVNEDSRNSSMPTVSSNQKSCDRVVKPLTLWDAMRVQDAQKYKIELHHSQIEKANRQKQFRDYLNMQVSAKKEQSHVLESEQKRRDYELTLQKVQEMRDKEELQRRIRQSILKQNTEINLKNIGTRGSSELDSSTNDPSNEGIHKLFQLQQLKSYQRQKQQHDNAHLLKDIMHSKQIQKKTEQETDKIMSLMAAECNDSKLEKSMSDYKQLVVSKERRNQLILKAQKDRSVRNFSTVEQEKNWSLERMFQKHQELNIQRQAHIHEERQELLWKIKKDVQQAHLSQIQLKRERTLEEQIVNNVIEGEQARLHALEFADQEVLKRVRRRDQQQQMRKELDQLVQHRREQKLEKDRQLNMVEFSMNKKSLKQLGITDKQSMELYYQQLGQQPSIEESRSSNSNQTFDY